MFVDRVIDNFEHHVMQSAFVRITDVHAGAFPDRFQTFELLDLSGVVLLTFVDVRLVALTSFRAQIFVFLFGQSCCSHYARKRYRKSISKQQISRSLDKEISAISCGEAMAGTHDIVSKDISDPNR